MPNLLQRIWAFWIYHFVLLPTQRKLARLDAQEAFELSAIALIHQYELENASRRFAHERQMLTLRLGKLRDDMRRFTALPNELNIEQARIEDAEMERRLDAFAAHRKEGVRP